jgi:hypothetical protein
MVELRVMFYAKTNGTFSSVNCSVQPNVDVSGVVVRVAFYFQALLSIVLAFGHSSRKEVLLSNISLQASSISLVAVAFFNPNIDVPHTIIITLFTVMLSACRYTSNDFMREELVGPEGNRMVRRIWVQDIICRPIIMSLNCCTWAAVRSLQTQNDFCTQGFGKWVFFGIEEGIGVAGFASNIAFALSVLDVVWEVIRIAAELMRLCVISHRELQHEFGYDPRVWCISKFVNPINWDWGTVCTLLRLLSQFYRITACLYVAWTIENIILANNIPQEETKFTIEQLIGVASMLILLCLLLLRHGFSATGPSHFYYVSQLVNPIVYIITFIAPVYPAFVFASQVVDWSSEGVINTSFDVFAWGADLSFFHSGYPEFVTFIPEKIVMAYSAIFGCIVFLLGFVIGPVLAFAVPYVAAATGLFGLMLVINEHLGCRQRVVNRRPRQLQAVRQIELNESREVV